MKNNNRSACGLMGAFCLVGLLWSSSAFSALINYSVANIIGNTWEYTYTVNNDLAVEIDEFTVYFDYTLYANLSETASPTDWDPLVIDPDDGIPADGLADWLGLVSGIALGDSLGGFSVSFDWLGGAGGPGAQFFEVVNPETFDVIASGLTMLAGVVQPPIGMPEPGALGLVLFGFLLTIVLMRRRPQSVAKGPGHIRFTP